MSMGMTSQWLLLQLGYHSFFKEDKMNYGLFSGKAGSLETFLENAPVERS